jgi:hypothetical protein
LKRAGQQQELQNMTEFVTLEVPDELVARAREVAARSNRPFEDVLVQWLGQLAVEPPVDTLSNDEVLALTTLQMDEADQLELGELLARQREGQILPPQRRRLDELMASYRQGLLRKSEALRVAVERGLRSSLT